MAGISMLEPDGDATLAQMCFQVGHAGLGVVKDRRGERRVGRADAALAASIFHYAETSVRALKEHLRGHGIPVRL